MKRRIIVEVFLASQKSNINKKVIVSTIWKNHPAELFFYYFIVHYQVWNISLLFVITVFSSR